MTSPYYEQPANFKPSNEALMKWLSTRKGQNSNPLPGIFKTEQFSTDQFWTFIAATIEFVALILTTYGAWSVYLQNQNVMNLAIAVIAVLLFIAFDVVGVLLHGSDKQEKRIELAKSRLERDPAIADVHRRKSQEWKNKEFFGFIFLVLSAMIKIVAVLLLFGTIALPTPVFLTLTLLYVLVVYIHLAHTGYWLAAIGVSRQFKHEFNLFLERRMNGGANNPLPPDRKIFNSPQNLPGGSPIRHGRQTVTLIDSRIDGSGNSNFTLELQSIGVLWDEDVVNLLSNFDSESYLHKAVLDACISLQLQQVGIIIA